MSQPADEPDDAEKPSKDYGRLVDEDLIRGRALIKSQSNDEA
jgi:hypothetical protein